MKPQEQLFKNKMDNYLFEKDVVLKGQEVRDMAAECLFAFSKNINISTISHFLQPIFK